MSIREKTVILKASRDLSTVSKFVGYIIPNKLFILILMLLQISPFQLYLNINGKMTQVMTLDSVTEKKTSHAVLDIN